MKKIMLLMTLVLISLPAIAGKSYTPQQLNRMISSGQYPDQGRVTDTQTKSISFSNCKVAVEDIMSQIRDYYPVETIVNTNILHMVKAWTNDGAITVTCSKADRKMVTTIAPYK